MFLGRSKVSALYLNRSKITEFSKRTFVGLSGLKELYLDHNQLGSLDGGQFAELTELEVLHLHNNHLQFISVTSLASLDMLRVLSLHHNRLVTLQLEISSQAQLQAVTIHANRWQCGAACQWVHTWHKLGEEKRGLTCDDGHHDTQSLHAVMSSCTDLDPLPVSSQESSSPLVIIIVSVAVVILLVLIIIGFLFILRHSLTAWVYSTDPVCSVPTPAEYSAYLHYCLADAGYVHHHVVPHLPAQVRLWLHHGDLVPNTTVGQTIAKAVSQSQSLLILASPAYFQSSIPAYELQMILAEGVCYPIIVLVRGDIQAIRLQFRHLVGAACDGWTFLDLAGDVRLWGKVLLSENIYQAVEDTGDQKQGIVIHSSQETRI
jgi:hypothetical protein